MSKLSSQALASAASKAWISLRKAHTVRRVVRSSFIALGLTGAVLAPLLNLPADPPANPAQTVNNTIGVPGMGDGPDHSHEHDKIPYLVPITIPSKREQPNPNPMNLNQRLKVVTDLQIRSAPAGKLWHRSGFDNPGDAFWALPDASFKLTLVKAADCNTRAGCSAEFLTEFEGFSNAPTASQLTVQGQQVRMSPQTPACQLTQDTVPYLVCGLRANEASRDRDVCLWMRRATKGESGSEIVALDIRWEKGGLGANGDPLGRCI